MAAARRRIDEAADRMAALLLGIATSAESETVRLAAIRDALDRAGLSARSAVEIEHSVKPWEQIAANLRGVAPITRQESRARRGLPDNPTPFALDPADDGDVLDAELVDEDTEMGPHLAGDERTGRRRPTDRTPPEPSPHEAAASYPTGMKAIEAAAAANRAAGVYPTRRRRG